MWHRFIGAGIELAAFALVAAAVGYGLDRWLGHERPLATAFCGLVGFSLGLVRFIVLANRANRTLHDSAVHRSQQANPGDEKTRTGS